VTPTCHTTDTLPAPSTREDPRAVRSCPALPAWGRGMQEGSHRHSLPHASPCLETVGNGKRAVAFCPQLHTHETGNCNG